MAGSGTTVGDLALRLYESQRFDAVCDALGMVVRCGGELDLRHLLIFAQSAKHLGRDELARWCQERCREALRQQDSVPVELRGLVMQAERLLADIPGGSAPVSLLSLRTKQRSVA